MSRRSPEARRPQGTDGTPSVSGPLAIARDEVHVWAVDLRSTSGSVVDHLSEDEVARADRFLRTSDRSRFVAARGMLRKILGQYMNVPANEVQFVYGPHGKPAVGTGQDSSLTFNVAHSGDLALYAVGRGRRIGIDVEQVRADLDYLALARRFFAPREVSTLRSLRSDEDRLLAFYTIWTGKEAFVKALGERLATGLKGVIVACEVGQEPALVSVSGDTGEVDQWCLMALDPSPGYLGSLVVEGRDWSLIWQSLALQRGLRHTP